MMRPCNLICMFMVHMTVTLTVICILQDDDNEDEESEGNKYSTDHQDRPVHVLIQWSMFKHCWKDV